MAASTNGEDAHANGTNGAVSNGKEADELFRRLMRAIHTQHSIGNTIRMVKLPLIFVDAKLYAGAIANFYWLTLALENALDRQEEREKTSKEKFVTDLRKHFATFMRTKYCHLGYEADIKELVGQEHWKQVAEDARTPATDAYCAILSGSTDSLELVAAAFILYGALVVGGGKATQRKVRKVFPACEHKLFDVIADSSNVVEARKGFKLAFNAIGEEHPEHCDVLEDGAKRFMGLNNTVVLSIRCTQPAWWWNAGLATGVAVAVVASAVVFWKRRK